MSSGVTNVDGAGGYDRGEGDENEREVLGDCVPDVGRDSS